MGRLLHVVLYRALWCHNLADHSARVVSSDSTLLGAWHRFPQAPLLAAGFSMGGLILTKFLGELGMGRWSPALGE